MFLSNWKFTSLKRLVKAIVVTYDSAKTTVKLECLHENLRCHIRCGVGRITKDARKGVLKEFLYYNDLVLRDDS